TLETVNPETKATLDAARFVYLRDSVSLGVAKREKIESPIVEFSPDGAFACDVRDDAAATAFLREHGLEEGKFLCCIPRYRMTPRWLFSNKKAPFEQSRQDLNDVRKEQDHAPLREAIAAVVRQTGLKVLICPEDETQVVLGKEMLLDKLPDDVRSSVV